MPIDEDEIENRIKLLQRKHTNLEDRLTKLNKIIILFHQIQVKRVAPDNDTDPETTVLPEDPHRRVQHLGFVVFSSSRHPFPIN